MVARSRIRDLCLFFSFFFFFFFCVCVFFKSCLILKISLTDVSKCHVFFVTSTLFITCKRVGWMIVEPSLNF